MKVPARETRKARIEIIPMIDTIFFLLVFFMFTSLSMIKMNGLGVSLPKSSASAQTPPPRIVVTVDNAGRYFLGASAAGKPPVVTPITPGALQADLQASVNADPRTLFIVNVAKSRNVQDLIDVMDAVNAVQIPPAARTRDNSAPAVIIATTPVDAAGQPLTASTETH